MIQEILYFLLNFEKKIEILHLNLYPICKFFFDKWCAAAFFEKKIVFILFAVVLFFISYLIIFHFYFFFIFKGERFLQE